MPQTFSTLFLFTLKAHAALFILILSSTEIPGVITVNDAIIFPCSTTGPDIKAGVLDGNGKDVLFSGFDTLSNVDGYKLPDSDQGRSRATYDFFTQSAENTPIFLGFIRRQWGHFLVDSLIRLWYVIENPSDAPLLYFGERIKAGSVDAALLSRLGIQLDRLVYLDHPVRVRQLIIPEPSLVPGKYVLPAFLNCFKLAVSAAHPEIKRTELSSSEIQFPQRLYLSRCKLLSHNKSEFGEERLNLYSGRTAIRSFTLKRFL